MNEVQRRRFQAGEGEVQWCAVHLGTGQLVLLLIPPLSQSIHGAAAGVADAQHPCHLIKAFAGGVISGSTQQLHFGVVLDVHDESVAAGDAEAEEGRLQVGVSDVIGGDMTPNVVDGDEGHTQAIGGAFGKVDPHQHRSDQPRCVGAGHSVDILSGHTRLL